MCVMKSALPRNVKVMVSSDQTEFTDLRAALHKTLLDAGFHPLLFEKEGALDDSASNAALRLVEECDIYVCVLGTRLSPKTLGEYERATELGRPRLVFVREGTSHERRDLLKVFLGPDVDERKYDGFATATDLSEKLLPAVSRRIASQLDRAQAELEDLGWALEKLFVGSRLLQSSTGGELSLKVEGAMRIGEEAVVLVGSESVVALPRGLELALHISGKGSGSPSGVLITQELKVGEYSSACTLTPAEHLQQEWEEFARALDDRVTKKLPWDVQLRLLNEERYRDIQTSIQLLVYAARKRVGA